MEFWLQVVLVLGIVVTILFGAYYVLALIFLWPRLLAKYLTRREKDKSKMKRVKVYCLTLQLLLFAASFLGSYFCSPKLFESILRFSMIGGGGLLAFEVLVYDLFPQSTGLTLVGPPPRFLLREIGGLWTHRILWVPTIALLFSLLLAAHFVGVLAILLGVGMALRFKDFIRRDEYRDNIDHLINRLKDQNQKMRVLSVILLEDIGGINAIQSLISLLGQRHYLQEHTLAIKALGRMRNPVAVKPLLSLLKLEKGLALRDEIIKALSRIAEAEADQLVAALKRELPAIRCGAAEALKKSGWAPKSDTEKIYYLAARCKWKKVAEFGADAKDALLLSLKNSDSETIKKISRILEQIAPEPKDAVP